MSQLVGCGLLIADANEDTRLLFEVLFQSRGANVQSVASGTDALQQFSLTLPDLVICDIVLPGIDGYELLDRIRTTERNTLRQTPVIAVTGWVNANVANCINSRGFDAWFMKPVDLDDVMAEVIHLIQLNKSYPCMFFPNAQLHACPYIQ